MDKGRLERAHAEAARRAAAKSRPSRPVLSDARQEAAADCPPRERDADLGSRSRRVKDALWRLDKVVDQLVDLEVRREAALAQRDACVRVLRAAGWSWERIAEEAYVSRQALQKRV